MLNKVIMQGRLVADPELKHTQSGVAVASARIAVDRDFKDKASGERKADFFPVTAWRGTGEFLANYFSKGRMIVVEGQLQNQEWTDKEGNKRITTEIIASSVYFGDSKPAEDNNAAPSYAAPSYAAPANTEGFAEISEDEPLPF